MLANDPQFQKLIYDVGLKFRDALNQKAFLLVTIDANGKAKAFHFFEGRNNLKTLINETREATNYLKTL